MGVASSMVRIGLLALGADFVFAEGRVQKAAIVANEQTSGTERARDA